jgi:hypothetical protein
MQPNIHVRSDIRSVAIGKSALYIFRQATEVDPWSDPRSFQLSSFLLGYFGRRSRRDGGSLQITGDHCSPAYHSTSLQRSRVQVGVRRGEDVQEGAAAGSRRRRQR